MKKILLAPVLILLVFVLFGFGVFSQTGAEPFCGTSTYGACSADSDCVTDGCNGQICRSVKEGSADTVACQWSDCNIDENYGMSCGCFNGKCQWFQGTQQCTGEGQKMPVYPGYECCSGLVAISPATPAGDKCLTVVGAVICSKCGNGSCESWENYCNCPADCEKGAECTDSDGGKNYYVKGTTTGRKWADDNEIYSRTDFCSALSGSSEELPKCEGDNCGVYEFYCTSVDNSKEFVNGTLQPCPNGCVDGACVEKGCVCPTVYAPVCGVDGKTYSNKCIAACAGVAVAYEGECRSETIKVELGQAFKLQEKQTAMLLENGRYIGIDLKLNMINFVHPPKCEEGKECVYAAISNPLTVEVEVKQTVGNGIAVTIVHLTLGQSTKVFGITLTNLGISQTSAAFVAKKDFVPDLIEVNLGEKFKITENQTALVQKKNETVMKLRFEGIIMPTCAGGGGSATTSSGAVSGGGGSTTCGGGEPYAQFSVSLANNGMHYITLRSGQSTELSGYRITLGDLSYSNGKSPLSAEYTASMLVEETFTPETVIAYLGKPFDLIKGQKAIVKETSLLLKLIELDNDVAVLEVSLPVIIHTTPTAGGSGGIVAKTAAVEQPVTTQVTATEKVQIVEAVKVSTEQGNIIRSPYVKLKVGDEQTIYGHKIKLNSIVTIASDCSYGECVPSNALIANFTVTKAEAPETKTVYLDEKFDLVQNQTAIVLDDGPKSAQISEAIEAMRVKLLEISQTTCGEPREPTVGEKEKEVICDSRPIVKVEVQLPVVECPKCECPTCEPCACPECECPVSSSGTSEPCACPECECPTCGPCACPACGGTAALLVLREGEERMVGGYVLRLLDVAGNKAVFIVRASTVSNIIKVMLDEEFKLQQKQTALVVEEGLYIKLEGIEITKCGTAEEKCVGGSFASVSVWKKSYEETQTIGVYKLQEGESLNLYGVKIGLLGLDAYGKSAKFVVTKESESVINVHTNEPFKLQLRQAARVLEANMRIDLMGISEIPIQCIRAPCVNPMQVEISVSNYLFSNEETGKAIGSSDYIETVVQETVVSKVSREVAVPVPPQPFQTFVLSEGESVEVNDFVIKLLSIGSTESAEFIVTKKGSGEKLFIEIVSGWNLFSIPGELDIIESKECDSSNMKIFEYIAKEKKFVKITSGKPGRAYWVYNPSNACSVKAIVRDAVPMSQLDSLVVGWNFVPVTVDMIGSKVRDIGKECSPKAAYFYNANSRKWQNAMDQDLSAADLGKAFALYATTACSLGGTELTPPMPPLPEGG